MAPIGIFRATLTAVALLSSGVIAASENAEAALESYIAAHPINTRSSSKASVDLTAVKNSILAGNYTSSRPWDLSRASCPESCMSLGLNASAWPVYNSVDRLDQCDEAMLLSFSLYNQIEPSSSTVSIRGCAADIASSSATSKKNTCSVPANSTSVTRSLELVQGTSGETVSPDDAVLALRQLLAYENTNMAPCNESINFAYSGQTAVGLYIGSSLHSQGVLASVLEDLIEYIEDGDIPESLFVQLCAGHSSRFALGIAINSDGGLPASQSAVRQWRDGECMSSPGFNSWKNLSFTVPTYSARYSNATRFQASKRALGRKLFPRDTTCTAVQVVANDTSTTLAAECDITATELATYNPSTNLSVLTVGEYICCTEGSVPDYAPTADSDGNCYSYLVQTGDYCSTLAATYTITVDEIESYNNNTWGWMGCDDLLANEYICLSSGYAPMPATISNAVCGPQVNGTATAPQGSDLSTLNECPLNACCDIWGQCGITSDFCTKTNSTTGAPGTAANGTNGCISNCGTDIIESDQPPSEFFKIGYFEGYDVERACMRNLITEVNTSAYTHIHMSFATLNADMTFNISSIESQMEEFAALSDVKRIITVGGWDFSTDPSTYEIFRDAFSESANRATLIDNTIAFLKEWDLDGIDWDWEYPGEPDIPGIPADTDDDATSFFLFLLELEESMSSEVPNKTISTTAPSSFWYMKAIPIDAIGEVVDYVVLMTYDMHGQWDWNNTNTDPGCPDGGCLRSHVNLTETLSALSMITKAGVDSNKVAVGVSSYARSFQMTESGCYGPNCTFTGPNSGAYPGPCTDTAGYISNAELASIAEEWDDVYSYIDSDSNSNIMVWNDTQWAGYMNDDVKASRIELYESMSFLGSADWAIDLLTNNDSNAAGSACQVYINPSIWDEDSPSVTAIPGCTLIWPPQPLESNTTINFPPWTTNFTYVATVVATATASSGTDTTKVTSHVSQSFPTILSIDPVIIGSIPVWNVVLPNSTTTGTIQLTSSVEPSPFTVVWTPTIGGVTVVSSPTTTAIITESVFVWGDRTFTEEGGTDILGGSTTVIGGTTLSPTTTTVTPVVYPSVVKSTPDPKLNTKTTAWKSGKPPSPTAASGCDGCGIPCVLFCDSLCPTCETGGGESGGGGSNGSSDDDDDDDDKTTTTCATTTTTSDCDVFCTITTSGSAPITSCTSTECYSVTGCDVTATTVTVTDATTAACPVVTAGSELQLDGDSWGGCEPCAWHFVPFWDEDDVDDDEAQFWPELAQSSFVWPDIDVKRRGLGSMGQPEIKATGNAMPASTITQGPMVTPPPRYGTYYGGHKNELDKRQGEERVTISKLGTCVLDEASYAQVPTHTYGDSWLASEIAGNIPETQTDMPRWYHTTTSNCIPSVTTISAADIEALNALAAQNKGKGKFIPTLDHAWEIGWLQEFFDKIFGEATDTFDKVLSCDQMNEIFFGCGTNSLQKVYNALPSDEHFEFVGMNKAVNQRKAKIAKNEWTGTWKKDFLNKQGDVDGLVIIKSTDPWIGVADGKKNKQQWGAQKKFESQKDLLWGMLSSCQLFTDDPIFDLMDTTNSRLFNVLTEIDASVAGADVKLATEFKEFMEDVATMTDTVQGYIKSLVKVIEDTQLDYVTQSAAKAAEDDDIENAITNANDLISSWNKLKAEYGLSSTEGAAVCGGALPFTWDTTVLKRDIHARDTTSAAACTISITTTASASATSSPICVAEQDPDDSADGTWCNCSGSEQKFPLITASGTGICGYTAFPSSLVTTATNPYPYTFTDSLGDKIGCASETKKVSDGTTVTACAGASTTLSIDYANNPYPYTFTDFYGLVEACEYQSFLDIGTVHGTYCSGSSTIIYDPTITVTEVVATSSLSNLCMGGSYWMCMEDYELQNICTGTPKRQMACLNNKISNAALLCQKLCVQVATTVTTTYTTLAP